MEQQCWTSSKLLSVMRNRTLTSNDSSERQISDFFKLKKFADDNFFKFDKNGRKFSKQIENAVTKVEISRNE